MSQNSDNQKQFSPEKEFKKPVARLARANAILEFIEQVNFSNIKLGALGCYGETPYTFDFDKAYGPGTNRYGQRVSGKSAQRVADDARAAANRAERAGKRACEICEYVSECPRRGRLFERLSSPEKSKVREKIRTRMRAVINSGGTKTMSCLRAAATHRPKKSDWDY